MARKSEIRTKKQALGFVATRTAATLQTQTVADLVGSQDTVNQMTNAEVARLTWAIEEVLRRLQAMIPASRPEEAGG